MKTLTKAAMISNFAIVATMGYMYYDKVTTEKFEQEQAEMVALEVTKQMHKTKELECLATNIYHEARNEGMTGQRAVAWVTLNRVKSNKYPDSICGVVYQAELNENGVPFRNKCQFSWFCDGKSDDIEDQASWNTAVNIAYEVMDTYGKETDPTNGSLMYHADYVTPYWSSSYDRQARIDSHIFYN